MAGSEKKRSGGGFIVKYRGRGNEKRTQKSQPHNYPGDRRDVNDRLPNKMRRLPNDLKNMLVIEKMILLGFHIAPDVKIT